MLSRARIDNLIPILRRDARRALRMRVAGFPRPYYCAFLLKDINWFNTWAGSGSVYRRRSDRTRNVNCDLRVGTYRYDQTTEGGLLDNDEDQESVAHVSVPIDDRAHAGLRLALWRLSESKFREALTDFNNKQTARVSTIDSNRKLNSFCKQRARKHVVYTRAEVIDEERWVRFCKCVSQWMATLPGLSSASVEFDSSQETKLFVSTENAVVVQHQQLFQLSAVLQRLTPEGLNLERDVVFNCATQRELPDIKRFKEMILERFQQLLQLAQARKIHSFSGPVLLYPKAAGLLFHEAIGHRLEGSRLLSSGEGSTFKGQIGKRVVHVPMNIYDDPGLKKFKGRCCIGAYDFDDEGSPGQKALLVADGILRGFLTTRAQIPVEGSVTNGHARTRKFQRAISRMGVTVVETKYGYTQEELKMRLLSEIRRQKKPYGMIVYETAGGETDTSVFDFQAFAGEISYATLIYPDGKEVVVRGVNFVGTPLQALNNIIAVGDDPELDNHYCGAESGYLPVSTIAPAILLSNLELQAKDEELVTQWLLRRPRV